MKMRRGGPNARRAAFRADSVLPSLFVMESKGSGFRDQGSEKSGKSLPTTH